MHTFVVVVCLQSRASLIGTLTAIRPQTLATFEQLMTATSLLTVNQQELNDDALVGLTQDLP